MFQRLEIEGGRTGTREDKSRVGGCLSNEKAQKRQRLDKYDVKNAEKQNCSKSGHGGHCKRSKETRYVKCYSFKVNMHMQQHI